MKRRSLVLIATLLPWITACATPVASGPGMIVTFRNVIRGKTLLFDEAVSANGVAFPNPGGLAPEKNPTQGGKTEGSVLDSRTLPEWIQFTWREPNYDEEHTYEQLKVMPRKSAQVLVRSRVPPDVVAEVIHSSRHREVGKISEKKLWVYFIWYENEIKFRWELVKGCCSVLQAGGDEI